ncbi:MAG TPA: ComEC/Rec2 family competence protein, partial [Patescibacteria group bacterium]|nr:ComEC/Rec2 family competence protein [Patescibacteria group bacterium]
MIEKQEIATTLKFSAFPALKILIYVITAYAFALLVEWRFERWLIALAAGIIVSLFCFFTKFRSPIYYISCALFGIWLAMNVQQISVRTPLKIIPEMKAVVQGRIIRVLKNEPHYVRLIVEGTVDTEALSRFKNTRVLLSIHTKTARENFLKTGTDISANVLIRLPRPQTLPTDFPEREYTSSLDVQWLARARAQEVAFLKSNFTLDSWRKEVTDNIFKKLAQLYPEQTIGILYALITGDKTFITQEVRQSYSLAGTSHLLAVSGFHVGIIATGIFLLLGFLKKPWLKFFIFLIVLSAFIILTGLQPSAIRSGTMAVLIIWSVTLQRRPNLANIAAISTLFILLLKPNFLISASFQMSIGAILGIALLYNPVRDFFKRIFSKENIFLDYILNSFSVTLAASIAVVPIVAYYFKTVTFISPLTNIFAIPVIALAMIWGLISLILSYIFLPSAKIFAVAASDMIHLTNAINDLGLRIPNAFLQGEQSMIVAVILSISLVYIMLSKNNKQSVFRFISSALACCLVLATIAIPQNETTKIIPREHYTTIIVP